MTQTIEGSVFTMMLNTLDSTFVRVISYDADTKEMSVVLEGVGVRDFADVPMEVFVEFTHSKSFGSFYHSNIKNKYKMAKKSAPPVVDEPAQEKRKPKKINRASDEYRYIEFDIDLDKINKQWLVVGEKSKHRFLKCKLRMEPDGEVDKYGNLGFISQTVPNDVYKKDKTVKGEILGNACELEWNTPEQEETHAISSDLMDDLPF